MRYLFSRLVQKFDYYESRNNEVPTLGVLSEYRP